MGNKTTVKIEMALPDQKTLEAAVTHHVPPKWVAIAGLCLLIALMLAGWAPITWAMDKKPIWAVASSIADGAV